MENCFKLIKFIRAVQRKSGKDLESYVATHKNDDTVIAFLKYTYDTSKYVYGLKPSTVSTHDAKSGANWDKLTMVLEAFNEERSNNSHNKEQMQILLDTYGIIAYSVLNRKIPSSVLGATTINKAIPGCIQQFKVAKAKDLDWNRVRDDEEYFVERKYDGNNIYIVGDRFYTREGHEVHLPHLKPYFKHNLYTLVTECCVGYGQLGDRRLVQGLITKGRKGTISVEEQESLVFFAFDYLTAEEWQTRVCTTPYAERRQLLGWHLSTDSMLLDLLNSDGEPGYPVAEAKYWCITGKENIQATLASELSKGFEGIVVKSPDHLYEWKRSWNWMRYKEAKTADLRVVDYEYGTGKYEGQLGALVCSGVIGDTVVEVRVGQGFSDDQRSNKAWYENLVGKIVEITYNEVTVNNSLSIPVFIGARHDKEDSDNA
jgi:ATP-dependent DNA ligase